MGHIRCRQSHCWSSNCEESINWWKRVSSRTAIGWNSMRRGNWVSKCHILSVCCLSYFCQHVYNYFIGNTCVYTIALNCECKALANFSISSCDWIDLRNRGSWRDGIHSDLCSICRSCYCHGKLLSRIVKRDPCWFSNRYSKPFVSLYVWVREITNSILSNYER